MALFKSLSSTIIMEFGIDPRVFLLVLTIGKIDRQNDSDDAQWKQ